MATTPSRSTASAAETPARRNRPIEMPPVWVTVPDAMRLAGIGRTMLYRLIGDGTLRSITIGRRRLVAYAAIEALGGEPV
jgi:excisionase family DNA binding protein